MKTFNVPIEYKLSAMLLVDAENEKEAVEKAVVESRKMYRDNNLDNYTFQAPTLVFEKDNAEKVNYYMILQNAENKTVELTVSATSIDEAISIAEEKLENELMCMYGKYYEDCEIYYAVRSSVRIKDCDEENDDV